MLILTSFEKAVFIFFLFLNILTKFSDCLTDNFFSIIFFETKKIKKFIHKDSNVKQLESSLVDKIGLNVSIKNKKNNSGSISFDYKNLEQLNRIIEIIKSNY